MLRMIRYGSVALVAALTLLSTRAAWALAPSDLWTAAGSAGAIFSADGSSLLTHIATGFQMRRAADGRLERTITLPSASRAFNAYAFSPDKQYVALTYRASGVTRIELFSVATGALVRVIDSGAVRNARGIDLSSDGRVALFERYAYGDGGYVRVFATATGALLNVQGPYTRNSSTELRFSPDGDHLAIAERMPGHSGVRVLNTSDWSTELFVPDSAFLFRWSADSASLWTTRAALEATSILYDEVTVPEGELLGTTVIDSSRYAASALTPDNRFFLASTIAQDALVFLRASDGRAQLTYTLGTRADPAAMSPTGELFAYSICLESGTCTLHVARVPSL